MSHSPWRRVQQSGGHEASWHSNAEYTAKLACTAKKSHGMDLLDPVLDPVQAALEAIRATDVAEALDAGM